MDDDTNGFDRYTDIEQEAKPRLMPVAETFKSMR
jgi:hypothetical protein